MLVDPSQAHPSRRERYAGRAKRSVVGEDQLGFLDQSPGDGDALLFVRPTSNRRAARRGCAMSNCSSAARSDRLAVAADRRGLVGVFQFSWSAAVERCRCFRHYFAPAGGADPSGWQFGRVCDGVRVADRCDHLESGTWYLGLPASSSHTLIGSIIGVGHRQCLWCTARMEPRTSTGGRRPMSERRFSSFRRLFCRGAVVARDEEP